MKTVMGSDSLYHVWFATKRRKRLLLGELGDTVKTILMATAQEKGINLLECQTMVDHVHLLVGASSCNELSWIMKLLKGRTSYELFRDNPDLKLDAGVDSLWQRGFRARLVPEKQLGVVGQYVRTQDERVEKYDR